MVARCVFCGADTSLYQAGMPICLECSKEIDAGRQPKLPAQKEDPRNIPGKIPSKIPKSRVAAA